MEVKPLKSLRELLIWDGPGDLKGFLDSLPPLAQRSPPIYSEKSSKKSDINFRTLVCHDFRNGYKDDRFCFGSNNADAYGFYQWAAVDTFVYFSHHFVTIPPCGWVHTAHSHGVKVLGTFITEWQHGESIWNIILNDDAVMENVINNLVDIAVAYKFEGWLLNVENKINPEKVSELVYFTKELTNRMRFKKPESEVIWYDSVTSEGKLKWQNALNDFNRCFFDVSDGIFLNYSWKEENLRETARAAGNRLTDVYVGVDVYGRNFYEGGGFNCYRALDLIRKYNLSAALFAQAWTYEVLGSKNYLSNENKLWGSLEPYLLYRGPTTLPLKTSFCQGFGKKLFLEGEVVEEGEWYNLSLQQLQPVWQEVFRSSSHLCSVNTDSAFTGGSCLSLWVDNFLSVRMMVFKIPLDSPTEFEFAYSVNGVIKYLSFNITFENDATDEGTQDLEPSQVRFLAEMEGNDAVSPKDEDNSISPVGEENPSPGVKGGESLSLKENENVVLPVEQRKASKWLIKRYVVPKRGGWMSSFKVQAEGPGLVIFGEVKITKLEQ